MRKHYFAGMEIEKLFKSSLRLTTVMTAVVLLLASCGFSAETSDVLSTDLQTLKDIMVHVLLKLGLENFEHCFTSV